MFPYHKFSIFWLLGSLTNIVEFTLWFLGSKKGKDAIDKFQYEKL